MLSEDVWLNFVTLVGDVIAIMVVGRFCDCFK